MRSLSVCVVLSTFIRSYVTASYMANIVLTPPRTPTATVIFLHGLGDTGHGWADAMEMLQARTPWVKYVLPTGATRAITINRGYPMSAWYDIKSFGPNRDREIDDVAGLEGSRRIIEAIIADEERSGIPFNRIIVGGFSQGAATSLYTAFQHKTALAGCIALSGYLPRSTDFPGLMHASNKATPLFMAHGTEDEVVMYDWGKSSHDFLVKAGVTNSKFVTLDMMGHSATPKELNMVADFIVRTVPEQ
eukprot:TRINITY_DN7313_c0_g1_i1.p1 TRINITY_DN7313_c0_g1~~TRINITY_DN7313_c0_g1_i1.p1  ORF type:complete len:247 (+),score=31.60 TRINITY_DN7313_c0_g1_i1:28-768(+)